MYNYPDYIVIPYVLQEGREKSGKIITLWEMVKIESTSHFEITGTGVTLFFFKI